MAHESRFYADYSSAAAGDPGMQSFEHGGHELFSLQTGMEMLGIPSKNQGDIHGGHHNPNIWRGFIPTRAGGGGGGSSSSDFHRSDFSQPTTGNLMVAPVETAAMTSATNTWPQANRLLVDDSSLRCLFPSDDGTEQPPHARGLSLSLCNTDTADAAGGMQSSSYHLGSNSRDGLFSKPPMINLLHPQQQQQQILLHDHARFFSSSQSPLQQPTQLKHSKYLIPAKELLTEFCSLGEANNSSKNKHQKASSQRQEGGPSSSSSPWSQSSLCSLDILELQKRKVKLLSMLEEVDQRYRKYCEQMRAVVASFEAAAGDGAAMVYSSLASTAMSRHFRCLRDGIVGQIKATKKAMGEKDPIAPGTTRGDTPRLKLLDQCLRQQKAFQQAGIMESHPWRPQRGLPERSVSVLRAWLFEHFLHPYPSDVDKHILARQTGLSRSQVSNWFINARVRLWKPMVEEMYLEEFKEAEDQSSLKPVIRNEDGTSRPVHLLSNHNPNTSSHMISDEQKPTPGQLLHHDSDSLSSIINHNGKHPRHHQHQVPRADNFGVVELDFSSYNECGNQHFGGGGSGGGGGGVSLTLGLQQHHGGGMSLSFSPATQHSLFFSRENMEDCQPAQFSIIDGEGQNLPYRNLMGSQLLHDLAG